MSIATLLILASGAGQYPDTLDNLRAGDVVPQVGLLLDRSCSMGWGDALTDCPWYSATYLRGNKYLDKKDQMKSVLVGCKSPNDGIIDLWSSRVNFSVYEFGSGTSLRTPFDSTQAQLESGILSIPATGATNMSRGLADIGRYFNQYFNQGNTLQCRPNFIVMLSDGNPNGGDGRFDWECTPPTENRYVRRNTPWLGSEYLFQNPDLLCAVPGDQNILTYTIGFGRPGDFSPSNLQNVAAYGGGEYFYASDAQQLNAAFENIISAIVAKSALFFAPIAIQTESTFASNYAYAASFKPEAGGPWRGTVKKYCVVPPILNNGLYSTTVDSCLFVSSNGTDLETNPKAEDLWTGTRSLAADVGGAGAVLLSQMQTTSGGVPRAPYYDHRNIVSWRPGTTGYVQVNPNTWTASDTVTNGCDHYRLLNRLYGYTYDANCNNGHPQTTESWPLGDPVHFVPTLLKYGECHDSQGKPVANACFLAVGMNDGAVHFFDSATGAETTALVPGELWGDSEVAHSQLNEIMQQPNLTYTHRYYVDGAARLYHEDDDADGIIDANETANLIFGLGRGGRAYYNIDVTKMTNGVLDTGRNPVYPLRYTEGTVFEQLQDTWAAPWMGTMEFSKKSERTAIFPSGHIRMLDIQEGQGGAQQAGTQQSTFNPPPVDLSKKQRVNCTKSGGFADFNGLDSNKWCSSMYFGGCNAKKKPCYDGGRVPLDQTDGPLTFNNGLYQAAALRIYFDRFDLHDLDVLRIEDGQGNLVGSYTRKELNKKWTPWVYGSQIVLRLITDGIDTKDRGFRVKYTEWVPGAAITQSNTQSPAGGVAPERDTNYVLGQDHQPTVYFVDMDKWNGQTPMAFTDVVTDDPVMLRITNDCGALTSNCIDQNQFPVLADMVCPITAEPAVFSEGDIATAVYWADECAQIWKAWTKDNGSTYEVRRMINLNSGQQGVDKDYRKIFRRLDLVKSSCPGRSVLGVYFGTGERPLAKDELQNPAVTNGRDLIGVVWDFDGLPTGLTQDDLLDVTSRQDRTAPEILINEKKFGWFITLNPNERMLRDPLVFDGTAFYKTYEPTIGAVECGGGSGIDRIYAVNNCNGAPAQDVNGNGSLTLSERRVWNGETEIGGGLFFFTPKDSPVLVSHADLSKKQKANLNERGRSRPGLFLWREY
ncbi:MAG: hypothetical protein AAFN74_04985 [Myxococcota bacterium]